MRLPLPRVLAVPVLAAALAAAAGCADVEGLHDEGDLGTVRAPQTLWKDIHPDPPPAGQNPGTAAVVPGLDKVPGADMRDANALEVLRADLTSSARQDGGTGRLGRPPGRPAAHALRPERGRRPGLSRAPRRPAGRDRQRQGGAHHRPGPRRTAERTARLHRPG